MADKTINTRIQVLNDTAEALATKATAVPLKGEIVYDQTNRKMKIGDGATALGSLKFVGGDEAQNFEATATGDQTDIAAITAAVGSTELHAGDTAIVKRAIGDGTGKLSYTAYVYDGEWKAMDGNYSADNVYFDDDLTYTVAIGTLAKPSSGSAKLSATGKSVKQVLSSIMAQEANPSKTLPTVTLTNQGGFGTFEIGTKTNLTYTAGFNPGSYTYGPATGITATSWSASCTGVTDKIAAANGTFEGVIAEASAKTVTVTANYTEGAVPKTNLGNDYPAGKIAAGTATKTSNQLIGVRYMFWGPMTADTALNSAVIRGLTGKKASSTGNLTFGAGTGAVKVVVAVPADRKITKVLLTSAMNADITSTFVKQGTQVQVNGADNYAATAYDVYVYQPASIDASETYQVTIG